MKPLHMASAIVFSLVAIAHLWRLFAGAEVVIEGWAAPMWVSVLGVIIPGGLAYMLWSDRDRKTEAK